MSLPQSNKENKSLHTGTVSKLLEVPMSWDVCLKDRIYWHTMVNSNHYSLRNFYNVFILSCIFFMYVVWKAYSPTEWISSHPFVNFNVTAEETRDFNQWCHIPKLNPFDSSILIHLSPPAQIKCRFIQPQLTTVDSNGILRFNSSGFQGYFESERSIKCYYNEIHQYHDGLKDTYMETEPLPFTGPVNVSHTDFVKVTCSKFLGINIYSYVHALVTKSTDEPKEPLEGLYKKYNVLLFMIDSLSRQQMIRQLPKTYTYLTKELMFNTMKGLMKIGDSTFPNLASILTGRNPEVSYQRFQPRETEYKPLDSWPFVWKLFSQKGYKTLFSEDVPSLNAFHYHHAGFLKQPTDHYMRPYWLAVEATPNHYISSPLCYANRPKHLIQLEYVDSFIKAYSGSVPYWALSFLTEVSHDHIGTVGAIDGDLVEFFHRLHTNGLLNDTFVFFVSDHGNRMNSIRHTYVGSVENNMPVSMIKMPETFKENYPKYAKSLSANTKRLVSHYDIYESLLDILALGDSNCLRKSYEYKSFGRSLFSNILRNRTCAQAGVPFIYCSCLGLTQVPNDAQHVVTGAKFIIKSINDKIANFSDGTLCAQLEFVTVTNAYLIESSEERRQPLQDQILRIMVKAAPSGGIFESVIHIKKLMNGKVDMAVLGEIDRIDRYGNQPHCIEDRTMRLYCYCQ